MIELVRYKDLIINDDDKTLTIKNVPLNVYPDGDVTYSSSTTLKLIMLIDLMRSEEIPSEIDFQKSKDINLYATLEDYET